MITGTFCPADAGSLGRMMSTAMVSGLPSPSVSIRVATRTDSWTAFA